MRYCVSEALTSIHDLEEKLGTVGADTDDLLETLGKAKNALARLTAEYDDLVQEFKLVQGHPIVPHKPED